MINNYLSNNSIFPPKIWAKQSDKIHTYEKSASESFDLDFNSNFYQKRSHIFKIIKILKLLQVNTYIKIRNADSRIQKKNNQPAICCKSKFYKLKNCRVPTQQTKLTKTIIGMLNI